MKGVQFYVFTFLLLPVSSFLPLFYHMSTAIEVIFDFDLICGKKLLLLLLLLLFRHPHSFIPDLNLPFRNILPTVAFFFFFRADSMDFPRLFPRTCEHIRFYSLVFCFPLFILCFRAVD